LNKYGLSGIASFSVGGMLLMLMLLSLFYPQFSNFAFIYNTVYNYILLGLVAFMLLGFGLLAIIRSALT